MDDWSPLEEDVLLKGMLFIRVTGKRDGQPRAGQKVTVRACGFV